MQTKARELYGKYSASSTLAKVFISFVVILLIGHILNPIMNAVYDTPLYYAVAGAYESITLFCSAIVAKLTLTEMFGGFGTFIAECKKQYSEVKGKLSIGKAESAALKEISLRKVDVARTMEEVNAKEPRFRIAFHVATLGGMGGYDAMRGQWGAIIAFPAIQIVYSILGIPGLILLLLLVVPLAHWSASVYLSKRPEALSHRVLIDAVVGMVLICIIGACIETAYFGTPESITPVDTSHLPPELAKIMQKNNEELKKDLAEGADIWQWAYWYLLVDHAWRFWPRPQMEAWLAKRYSGVKLLLLDELPAVFGACMVALSLVIIMVMMQDIHGAMLLLTTP